MRSTRLTAAVVAVLLLALVATACTPQPPAKPAESTATTEATTAPQPVAPALLRIGNLPTEDLLPLWVAEKDGMFRKAGITVKIVTFQSAQERDAACTAGAIDGYMGDMIAVGELYQAGFKNQVVSLCLGATPAEGRFGIAVPGNSSRTSMNELANVAVGTSSGTIQEYVLDGLMAEAGVPQDQVKKEEVKKVPVRFQLLMNGQLKAAALPEPFLSLAKAQGARIVADDTKGKNLSQTVLAFSKDYLDKPEGAEAVKRLLAVWDEAGDKVNAKPDAYRDLLVSKARLPEALVKSYQVNKYPKAQLPQEPDVQAILDWMRGKKLLSTELTYQDIMWQQGAAQ
jgi:NitT/TauT family transport system substrate-binding protein